MPVESASRVVRPRPTAEQLAWADCEIGVIIHLDIQVFEPGYDFRRQRDYQPDPRAFRPHELDTDQWLETAVQAGARYAVLVAKHCSGFSLWPTEAHDYGVHSASWRDGKGDVVGDFIRSCEKYGVKPGLYYSTTCNAYCHVDNPGRVLSGDAADQLRYNDIVIQQLTELWTRYGQLFEIWFDGGTLPKEQGGPDVAGLLWRLQPQAVCFQGPAGTPNLIRWVGNERGEAPYPCWSTTSLQTANATGDVEFPSWGPGDPEGMVWAPAESDMPNRDQRQAYMGGWFWRAGEDRYLYSLEHLVERYYLSVGRNTNLLLGMVIDDRGLVPAADVQRFTSFGAEIRRRFGQPLAQTSGSGQVVLRLPTPARIDHIVTMEDVAEGHTVRGYVIEGRLGNEEWRILAEGSCVGHKRIDRLQATTLSEVRWRATKTVGEARLRQLAAYGPA